MRNSKSYRMLVNWNNINRFDHWNSKIKYSFILQVMVFTFMKIQRHSCQVHLTEKRNNEITLLVGFLVIVIIPRKIQEIFCYGLNTDCSCYSHEIELDETWIWIWGRSRVVLISDIKSRDIICNTNSVDWRVVIQVLLNVRSSAYVVLNVHSD